MKRTILISALCLMAITVFAQENQEKVKKPKEQSDEIHTLFDGKNMTHGGFGGFSTAYTHSLLDRSGLLLGVNGGWVMNHWFSLGFSGYGLSTPIHRDIDYNTPDWKSLDFFMGYGGLLMEFGVLPRMPVHLTFPVLIGAGGAVYMNDLGTNMNTWNWYREDADAFFVVEPGANVEFNLLKHFRMGFGLQYRWVDDLYLVETSSDALNGLSYNMTFKIGKF